MIKYLSSFETTICHCIDLICEKRDVFKLYNLKSSMKLGILFQSSLKFYGIF